MTRRERRPQRRPWQAVSLSIGVLAAITACADAGARPPRAALPTPVPPPAVHDVQLGFDAVVSVPGDVVPSVVNDGTAKVDVRIATVEGGRLVRERGVDGPGVRFPRTEPGSRAAAGLVVRPSGYDDPMDPGDRDFVIGADLRLDDESERAPDGGQGSDRDNGDNVIQRGLSLDAAQLKLQVDHGEVSCVVDGTEDELVVSAGQPVLRGRWYRVQCSRFADRLELSVVPLDPADGQAVQRVTPGRTGDVSFGWAVPLSVGAKVSAVGALLADDSDQFNGVLDNVFLDISDQP